MTIKITPWTVAEDYAAYLELEGELKEFQDARCWEAHSRVWQQLEDLKRKYDGHIPQTPPLTEAK